MKTIRRRVFFHILLLLLSLVGVALAQSNNTNLSNYVILKLKDHTTLEGPVLSENDGQIVITSQFGGGTITRKDTIVKDDIDSITRLTEAERQKHLAPWAYKSLDKYQLDPQTSYPLAYYDKIIDQYFKPFLTDYPNTVEAGSLTSRLADWQAERDKVASDQAKYRGQWMTVAEAEKHAQHERMQQILQRAKALMSQGQYQAATETLSPWYTVTQPPELAQESRRLQTEIYHLWTSNLESAQQQLTKDAEATKDRITHDIEAKSNAESKYNDARNALINTDRRTLGHDATVTQAGGEMLRAQKELADVQTFQAKTQEELSYTIRTLADVRHNADVFTVSAFPMVELVKETEPLPLRQTRHPRRHHLRRRRRHHPSCRTSPRGSAKTGSLSPGRDWSYFGGSRACSPVREPRSVHCQYFLKSSASAFSNVGKRV